MADTPTPSAGDLWQDLLEKDDRTSPEEYPDMALITFEEFESILTGIAAQARAAAIEEAAGIIERDSQAPRRSTYGQLKIAIRALSPPTGEST